MDFLGDKFLNAADKELTREEAMGDYDLVMVLYTASWCQGCVTFNNNLQGMYAKWNKDGKKVQVVVVSGDQDKAGFKAT